MASGQMATIPMIVDVDTGIDDALALLYACASPEVELVAVTCVSGNVHVERAARNSMHVLDLAGRSDVEVAIGVESPLRRPLSFYEYVHGPSGLGDATAPEPTRPFSGRHAADLLINEASKRPGEITLVTLGPMTNLALACLREPRLPRMLGRLVIMGGAYRWTGNASPVAEANVYMDPEAAERVFTAFAATEPNPTAIGLDVTERTLLSPHDLDEICEADPSAPLSRFLRDAVPFYFGFYRQERGLEGAALHDPLALAVAIDPSLVRTEPVAVEVELAGEWSTGQTVADWHAVWRRREGRGQPTVEREPNLDVAVDVDAPTFVRRFVERLRGLVAASA